ncbi:MAG: hypothetical protein JO190_02975 [Candidatus Eremiobacteraeota bacterium]|nr:hypothetical protein [Candidatus Eremiobacteraeota bacterium]MBV8498843.1 hypothetical protein [Candidatus Eremiobacteraeota bacterium]
MKRTLAQLLDLAYRAFGLRATAVHNDALRANQFGDPTHTFRYWRSLVS